MHNKIIKTLCNANYSVHIVGGAVRDLLSGETPNDFDIVTNATTDEIIPLFPEYKVDLVGELFNVLIIEGIEVSSYRTDCYKDGELASCTSASTIEEDLSRRDLTINSIALCPISGDIIDPFDGLSDIKNKIIKFTGNPEDRIKEDPCRILRACRFLAKIGGTFDNETDYALDINGRLVKTIAPERIRAEIIKAMSTKGASLFFDSMAYIGILKFILKDLDFCYGLDGGSHHNESVFEHCMIAGDAIHPKFPLLKLTAYLHDLGKYQSSEYDEYGEITFHAHEKLGADIVEEELKRLKFSNEEIKYISHLIEFHMRSLRDISPKAMRRLISKFYENDINYKDYLRLKIADRKANLKKNPFTIQEIKVMIRLFQIEMNCEKPTFSVKDLAIDGTDVMQVLGIEPGKKVGAILKGLFEAVLDNPELNTVDKLLELVENVEGTEKV